MDDNIIIKQKQAESTNYLNDIDPDQAVAADTIDMMEIDRITQEIAVNFIEQYHYRTPDYDYVAAVKDYVSESYYEFLSENRQRQTYDREYQLITDMLLFDTSDTKTDTKRVGVYVSGQYMSDSGDTIESEDMYIVTLEYNDTNQKWEVTGSWTNLIT